MGPGILLQQLASGVYLVAGVLMVKSILESPKSPPASHWVPICPTCCGTGKIPCLCNRWSDGDVGCRSCDGSGKTSCRSCGGSGRGRPRASSIRSSKPPTS
ncbi:hypothetical protein KP509_07G093600 [Ceratopteris richardii]|uniref:Uncharacterized protein n=1 Tax=Ceratopteris richardii TaxID=49495 RepID=A0A8T2UJC6_CERRI|nr:hypothetical protein KP509_07G093600 [Ceratopteris richardii]